ncbi:MAG: O-methyltransferase, partial [Clostridia bacterium]|nr:O-methyltransferase [Clostridia bacterium]
MKYTASLAKPNISAKLRASREEALSCGVPVADDETMNFLLVMLAAIKPVHILEIGTAVGLSAVAMAQACPNAVITTLEIDEDRYLTAKQNFAKFGVEKRIVSYLGDAGEILSMMDGEYDFVFLDGPKAQYEKYLFDLKRLMKKGATLFADDVLLFGWVDGKEETPQKRRSIVEKIRSYLSCIVEDKSFVTSVLDIG